MLAKRKACMSTDSQTDVQLELRFTQALGKNTASLACNNNIKVR